MSAARKLAELLPEKEIILLDAQLAGEGASGRNSGYLVDTTLNDGFTSNKELNSYKIKTQIYFIKAVNLLLRNIKLIVIGMSVENILPHPKKKT